jgi:hypothetical protein
MKTVFLVLLTLTFQFNFAQKKKSITQDNDFSAGVVMTWNKDTPETEMQDDIKSLRQNNGVTIEYSKLKRNDKNEIIALRIEYKDNDGNSGSQEYTGKNPIDGIRFHKDAYGIGFGESQQNMGMAFNNFDFGDLQKQFQNRIQIDTLGNNKSYSFNFNDENETPKMQKKSKIIIQKDGKKPLVIEDGKVIEGQDDYSKEEIEKIQNENKLNSNDGNLNFNFNSDAMDLGNLKEQMEKMQRQLMKIMPDSDENSKSDAPKSKDDTPTREELKKTKDEMLKAKDEMEQAKKELQKAKSELKTRKI